MALTNVQNIVVRAATINMLPYVKWTRLGDQLEYDGLQKILLSLFFHVFNKRFNLVLNVSYIGQDDMGHEITPGNWSGPLGNLIRQEADILLGAYVAIPGLDSYLSYTAPVDDFKYCILSGPPQNIDQSAPSLFSSVRFDVWIALGISWILATMLYLLFYKTEVRIGMGSTAKAVAPVETLLTFYGLLFQRGFENLPDRNGRRILITGWLFIVFFLTIQLSGALSSRLAVEDVPERIDKLEDILKYPDLIPYVSKGTVVDTFIMTSENPGFQKVWNRIIKQDGYISYPEIIGTGVQEQVSKGTAVHIGTVEGHLLVGVNTFCRQNVKAFYISKELFGSTFWGGVYRKAIDPVVVEAIAQVFAQFGSMGFHQEMVRSSWFHSAPCFVKDHSRISYSPTELSGMTGVFKMWALGLTSSSALFLCERIFPSLFGRASKIAR